jgi:hypothetical protein
MNFRLYAARHAWLLVPDCMRAPQAAVDRFGPLEFLGEVDPGELASDDVARIMAEIDAAAFAVVPGALVQRLFRPEASEPA